MRKRVIKQEVEENSLVIQYFCASTLYVPICWLIVILFCKLWGEEEHPVPYLDSAYHNGISILHNGKRFLCFGMPISIITKILRITKESMEFFFLKHFSFCVFPLPYFLIGVVIPSSRGQGAEAQQLCPKKFLKLWTLELSKGECILNWSYLVHDFFFSSTLGHLVWYLVTALIIWAKAESKYSLQ